MQKKAQVKFGESIAIIIIVYIVLMSSLIWYNNISKTEINKMYIDDQAERAFEKYTYIDSLDLLHVSQRGIADNEFDKNSLIAFSNYTSNNGDLGGKEHIRKQLGESLVTIKIYNYTSIESFNSYLNLTLYNNTPKDYSPRTYDKNSYKTLVAVVDSNEKRTDIGLLEIYVFVKKR